MEGPCTSWVGGRALLIKGGHLGTQKLVRIVTNRLFAPAICKAGLVTPARTWRLSCPSSAACKGAAQLVLWAKAWSGRGAVKLRELTSRGSYHLDCTLVNGGPLWLQMTESLATSAQPLSHCSGC